MLLSWLTFIIVLPETPDEGTTPTHVTRPTLRLVLVLSLHPQSRVKYTYALTGNGKRQHIHTGMFTGTAETIVVFLSSVCYCPVAETRGRVRLPTGCPVSVALERIWNCYEELGFPASSWEKMESRHVYAFVSFSAQSQIR